MNMTSGMDTQKTIQQLLQVEREPLKRMDEEIRRDQAMIGAWEEVLKRSRTLADKSRVLYSFAGPFSTKKLVSSDPGAVSGESSPRVDALQQELEILALASREQIQSDAVASDETLPQAVFHIGTSESPKKVEFPGGNIAALQRQLAAALSDDFEATIVRVDDKSSLLVLRSAKSGKDGRFRFTDEQGFLKKIGLIRAGTAKITESGLTFAVEKEPLRPSTGTFEVLEKGAQLKTKGTVSAALQKTPAAGAKLVLEIDGKADPVSAKDPEKKSGDKKSESIRTGPDIQVDVNGVKLHGYDVERTREIEEGTKPQQEPQPEAKVRASVGIVYKEGNGFKTREAAFELTGKRKETISLVELADGRAIERVFFSSEGGTVTWSSAKVVMEEPGKGIEAAHMTTPGQDARIKLNGVEITRPTNLKLTDIIDGVSLNLHKVTTGPTSLSVAANVDDVILRLKDWVTAYNDLMKFCRVNSKVETKKGVDKDSANDKDIAEGWKNFRTNAGIFATDQNIRQLMTQIRYVTSSAYPATVTPPFKVLNDIGISTGETGRDWEEIQFGYLVIDEEKLRRAVLTNTPAVKELFASDMNEDNVPDNGVAIIMTKTLDTYNRPAGGVVATRIQLLKTQIADKKDRISKKEAGLKVMEENLRRRFGRMENAIRQSKTMSEQMRNQMRSGGGE